MNITDKQVDAAQDTYDMFAMSGVCDRNAIRKSIEAAMQAAWVSVDDELPTWTESTGRSVTVNTDRGVLTYIKNITNPPCWCDLCGFTVSPPSYWMPLPEYKEVKK
jgi:hypothetical protein